MNSRFALKFSEQSHSDLQFRIQTLYLKQLFLLALFMQGGKASLSAIALLQQHTHLRGLGLLHPSGGCLQRHPNALSLACSWISLHQLSSQLTVLNMASQHTWRKLVPKRWLSGSNQDEGFGR